MDHQQQGRERALVNNPNYAPQPSSTPYSPFAPPAQQPPFDPFQRRDPFLPAPSADRRDGPASGPSQWAPQGPGSSGRLPETQQRETLQPAPAPPQSSFHTRPPSVYGQEQVRGGSLNGSAMSGSHPHAPPPQSFVGRNMPPPSAASPLQSPGTPQPTQMSRGHLPTPPSFAPPRDRPASGSQPFNPLSISSILERNLPQQQPNYSQITPRPAPGYLSSESPHRNQHLGPGSAPSLSYTPQTPNGGRYDAAPSTSGTTLNHVRSPLGQSGSQPGSPEAPRHRASSIAQQLYQSMVAGSSATAPDRSYSQHTRTEPSYSHWTGPSLREPLPGTKNETGAPTSAQTNFPESSPSFSRRTVSDDYRTTNHPLERPSRERSVSDMAGLKAPVYGNSGARPVQDAEWRKWRSDSQIDAPELQRPSDYWRDSATNGATDGAVSRTVIRSREGPIDERAWERQEGVSPPVNRLLQYSAFSSGRDPVGINAPPRGSSGYGDHIPFGQPIGNGQTKGQELGHSSEVRPANVDQQSTQPLSPNHSFRPSYGPQSQNDDRYARILTMPTPSYAERRYGPPETRSEQLHDRFATATPTLDGQLRQHLEESQVPRDHRALLNTIDSSRRMDRASPLPQAVQGASSQPAGSGRDPTIKSEFGRMFSGIGSGFGSTPQPMQPASNGSPTPARQNFGAEDERPDGETSALHGAPVRKKSKRPWDEDLEEASDQERTKSRNGNKGRKRSKNAHQNGAQQLRNAHVQEQQLQSQRHHHHHTHAHSHAQPHHHHYRNRKTAASPDLMPPARHNTTTPYSSTLKFGNANSAAPAQSAPPGGRASTSAAPAATNGPLHHHHSHHHHHHPTMRRPARTSVRLSSEISDLMKHAFGAPSNHLGSILYTVSASPPPRAVPLDTHFRYQLNATPLPTSAFNSTNLRATLTVRIPRTFLTNTGRELATLQRRVWGTDIYTDDSDVLAACVHAGFVRGKWDKEVDESMLDSACGDALKDADTTEPASTTQPHTASKAKAKQTQPQSHTQTQPPGLPTPPPPSLDLHVTLQILPALKSYASTTRYGMRSRSWKRGNHDGVSFAIRSVDYVDEGEAARMGFPRPRGRVERKRLQRDGCARGSLREMGPPGPVERARVGLRCGSGNARVVVGGGAGKGGKGKGGG
ncbi:MAG: hypothetical protein M1828_007553 [Chrysothrix sp. TS-e1954]|nr:MAG: hypothetical protein M1828_007553 [Chrysothrix sp. TS-e1954]